MFYLNMSYDRMSRDILKGEIMTKEQFKKYGQVIKSEIRGSKMNPALKKRGISHTNTLIARY